MTTPVTTPDIKARPTPEGTMAFRASRIAGWRRLGTRLALLALLLQALVPLSQPRAAAAVRQAVVDPFRIVCTATGIKVLPTPGGAPKRPCAATCPFCVLTASPGLAQQEPMPTPPRRWSIRVGFHPFGILGLSGQRGTAARPRAPPPL